MVAKWTLTLYSWLGLVKPNFWFADCQAYFRESRRTRLNPHKSLRSAVTETLLNKEAGPLKTLFFFPSSTQDVFYFQVNLSRMPTSVLSVWKLFIFRTIRGKIWTEKLWWWLCRKAQQEEEWLETFLKNLVNESMLLFLFFAGNQIQLEPKLRMVPIHNVPLHCL